MRRNAFAASKEPLFTAHSAVVTEFLPAGNPPFSPPPFLTPPVFFVPTPRSLFLSLADPVFFSGRCTDPGH
eukprot:647824-Rhodomonas_salina.1